MLILKGFAGVGKTSLVGAVVKTCQEIEKGVVLMAPTGRAANVLSHYAAYPASTIHRTIYRQKSPGISSEFVLGHNKLKNTLFIVDEASMIADKGDGFFGSGSLLDDMLSYVHQGVGCQLIIIGDTAQLPPVFYQDSPALCEDEISLKGYDVEVSLLQQVVRQKQASGILHNATTIRNCLQSPYDLFLKEFPDALRTDAADFIENIENSFRQVGIDETLIVTRSNKKASMYAMGIRNRVLCYDSILSNGERLMVVKNNYLYGEKLSIGLIANGDILEVVRMGRVEELYGKHFIHATLRMVDYNIELDALLLQETLFCEQIEDLNNLNKELFAQVEEDYLHIKNKRERYKQMRKDKYLNALQIKFAYAVTCHKAQGGQWQHVYIDMGKIEKDEIDISFVRWLYTAVTRATKKVFFIQFSDKFFRE